MLLPEEELKLIEQQAKRVKNVSLLLMIQILEELRELKILLKIYQKSSNYSDNSSCSTDNCKD